MTATQTESRIARRDEAKAHDVVLVARWADWRRADVVNERLKTDGYTVWAPWWEVERLDETVQALDYLDPESPVLARAHGRLVENKMGCLLAIQAARCLVLCQPAGPDCHIQAGYAQALGVPIVVYDMNATSAPVEYHYHRGVLAFDWPVARDMEALAHWVHLYAKELPARQAVGHADALAVLGQGDGRIVIEGR